MKIYCISEGQLWRAGTPPERIECGRVRDYLQAVNDMKKRDEWKTTGKGAAFMNVTETEYDTDSQFLRSIGTDGTRLIYTTFIDRFGGMYFKDTETGDETYIFANQTVDPGRMSFGNGKCCIEIGEGAYERHLALVDTNNGGVEQLTEGFTSESTPFISRHDPEKIYYTAMGYAQDNSGRVQEKSPCSVCAYSSADGSLTEVVSDPEHDYIKPSDSAQGDLYYIRRKYQPIRRNSHLGEDIAMFPVRIVKAIGGFLSVFSMRYGGEPLRTGGSNPAKNREADEKELFVEGNLIKAKQLSEKSDPDEGIIPEEWTLIKRSPAGEETVVLRGVMDYVLTDGGDIVYSDGRAVRLLRADGKKEKVCSLKLANCLTIIEN